MKKIVSTTLKSLILIAEIVCPYILAYVYEMQNQRYREMIFYPESNASYMMIIMTILLPLGFLILDIIAAKLIYEKGLWKLAILAIGLLNLAIIPITLTGNVIPLYFKMVPLYSGGKLMMFILNNFILIWLALAAVIKSRRAAITKPQNQEKEEGEV